MPIEIWGEDASTASTAAQRSLIIVSGSCCKWFCFWILDWTLGDWSLGEWKTGRLGGIGCKLFGGNSLTSNHDQPAAKISYSHATFEISF